MQYFLQDVGVNLTWARHRQPGLYHMSLAVNALKYYYTPCLVFVGTACNVLTILVLRRKRMMPFTCGPYLVALAAVDITLLITLSSHLVSPPWDKHLSSRRWLPGCNSHLLRVQFSVSVVHGFCGVGQGRFPISIRQRQTPQRQTHNAQVEHSRDSTRHHVPRRLHQHQFALWRGPHRSGNEHLYDSPHKRSDAGCEGSEPGRCDHQPRPSLWRHLHHQRMGFETVVCVAKEQRFHDRSGEFAKRVNTATACNSRGHPYHEDGQHQFHVLPLLQPSWPLASTLHFTVSGGTRSRLDQPNSAFSLPAMSVLFVHNQSSNELLLLPDQPFVQKGTDMLVLQSALL